MRGIVESLPAEPPKRGYRFVYRDGERNNCPGCGHSNWYIGRSAAECAFCATAVPLESSAGTGNPAIVHRRRG